MIERDREHILPGLYVHVPFCKTKCPYCDFYSVTDCSLIGSWCDALEREMVLYKDSFDVFDSLYFGGGTPSLLESAHMEGILHALRSHFHFSSDTEITVEVNPDDVTENRLEHLRSLGINRLSIGIQSFRDEELRFLKRRHSASGAMEAIQLAKSCGFKNFGIDLMYGFSGHTLKSWTDTLERAVSYEPAHLSCYQFTLEETTPFGRLKLEGKLKVLTEDEEIKFFLFTSDFLKHKGFIHYEISNFARSKNLFSRHNLKYWGHIPYLGLGPGAHSFLKNRRWWNHRSVEQYCRILENGDRPVEGSECLTTDQLRLERLFLGFRTERGVSLDDACMRPASDTVLSRLKNEGFVTLHRDRIIPTKNGFLIADSLPHMFLG